jgi:DNA polymerase III sliding clamp (beta) subunit (PCNA family)
MSTHFTITTSDLRTISGAVGHYASKDVTLPMLGLVELTVEGTTVVAMATDRYRLGVVRVPLADDTVEGERQGTVVIPATQLAMIAKSVDKKVGLVRFTSADDAAVVTDVYGGASWTIQDAHQDVPPMRKLLAGAISDAQKESGHALAFGANPAYMADLKKSATALGLGREVPAVFHPGSEPGKPFLVTIGEHFILLQMPMRLGEEVTDVLAGWSYAL